MDPVRFGRVLGGGAKAAAKTVVAAVDAATAPNPRPPAAAPQRPPSAPPQPRHVSAPLTSPAQTGSAIASSGQTLGKGLHEGAKRFGRDVWNPFVRLSGVLWLEVTGVFFGIFALFACGAAWHLRWAWHVTSANTAEHQRLLGAIFMSGLFGYFTVSSFVRAKRRERRR